MKLSWLDQIKSHSYSPWAHVFMAGYLERKSKEVLIERNMQGERCREGSCDVEGGGQTNTARDEGGVGIQSKVHKLYRTMRVCACNKEIK